jgi:hypothetical protein
MGLELKDLTGVGAIFDFGSKIIDKLFPDPAARDAAKLELMKQQQAGEFKDMEMALAISQGQMAINQVEAASASFFRGGWRPFIGWVCGVGCAWNWIGLPVATFALAVAGKPVALSPADLSEMMPLLLGMLGLGGLRTWERLKGKA